MKKLTIVTLVILSGILSGCTGLEEFFTPLKNAEEHYETCRLQHYNDFVELVKCGRAARYKECSPSRNCSTEGNAFVRFADGLANDVENNIFSEAEAHRYLDLGIQALKASNQQQGSASSLALINLGNAIASGGSISSSPSNSSRPTGYLKSQVVSGTNRICYYNVMGSTKTLNVRASSACPISYKF